MADEKIKKINFTDYKRQRNEANFLNYEGWKDKLY